MIPIFRMMLDKAIGNFINLELNGRLMPFTPAS